MRLLERLSLRCASHSAISSALAASLTMSQSSRSSAKPNRIIHGLENQNEDQMRSTNWQTGATIAIGFAVCLATGCGRDKQVADQVELDLIIEVIGTYRNGDAEYIRDQIESLLPDGIRNRSWERGGNQCGVRDTGGSIVLKACTKTPTEFTKGPFSNSAVGVVLTTGMKWIGPNLRFSSLPTRALLPVHAKNGRLKPPTVGA